jgi:hypothetical protein
MFDRKQLESLLKVNGIQKTSPDEEIRSVLISARFKDDEVDTALMILRENVQTKQTRVEGLHKVFRTDQSLKPSEISSLLGIEVDIKENIIVSKRRELRLTFLQFLLLWVVSILVAMAALMSYMYSNDMGFFHTQTSFASYDKGTP